jgi:hypothetical protein
MDDRIIPNYSNENTPANLAKHFGDQAMYAYHDLKERPASPKRSAEIEWANFMATLAVYHLLRNRA